MAKKTRQFAMKTVSGEMFVQTREVPIGSNWPTKGANDPPRERPGDSSYSGEARPSPLFGAYSADRSIASGCGRM